MNKLKYLNHGDALAEVYLNDEKLQGVKSVNISHEAGERPIVNLELYCREVDIEGEFEVQEAKG